VKKYQANIASAKPVTAAPLRATVKEIETHKSANKLGYKEQRELGELPKRIEVLEQEQVDIAAHLADGSIFRSDTKRAKQLQTRNEEIEAEVLAAMARWEELEKKR